MYTGTLVASLLIVLVSESNAKCPDSRKELHDEIRLHKNLSCASDNSYRPVKDTTTAVDVKMRFDFKYMTFDNEKETVTIFSWIVFNWKDEFLRWNVSDHGGIEEIQMDSHDIWTPVFSLLNADLTLYFGSRLYTTCLITSDGTVTCVPQLAHTAICTTTLSHWPHDQRNCTLYYTPWMQTEDKVNLSFHEKDPVVIDEFQNAPGWKLLDIVHDRSRGRRTCCPYADPMLTISFILKRDAVGLVATVVIPSVVIVSITLSSLLLNFDVKTRLSLMCFSLLGHFVFISEICFLLPKLSSDTPHILLFIKHSMFLTLLCVWETLILMSLSRKLSPAPSWLTSANQSVYNGPAKYIVFTEFDMSVSEERKLFAGDDVTNDRRSNMEWIKFANFINSSVVMLYVVAYSLLICIYFPTGQ